MERLSELSRRYMQSDARVFGKAAAIIAAARLENASATDFVRGRISGLDASEVEDTVAAAISIKSAIPGLERDPSLASSLQYIAQGMVDDSTLGRVPGVQRQLFNEQLALGSIVGVGATWRKSGRGIRVAPASFSGVSLHRGSVAGIVVGSKEFFELAIKNDAAASVLASLLRDAVRVALDDVFVGTAAAVEDQQPAGIGYAAQTVAATGATVAAIALDVRTMVSTMVAGGVSLRSGVWIMSAEAYSFLSSSKILDANGQTLAGRPIVSDAPSGTFMLVAPAFLTYARDDGVSIRTSDAGTIELDSAPSGDTATPTAMSHSIISLFQSDAVAVKATLDVDWAVSGPSDSNGNFAAVRLTGSSYA